MYAPRPGLLHEPVHESAAVIDNLPLDSHLRMLDAGDERSGGHEIDIEPVEGHGEYFAGNLFDPTNESLCIDHRATMRPVDEPNREVLRYSALRLLSKPDSHRGMGRVVDDEVPVSPI